MAPREEGPQDHSGPCVSLLGRAEERRVPGSWQGHDGPLELRSGV